MTVITKKTTAKEISRLLRKKSASKKVMDIKEITGKLSWKGDALKVQRRMRDER